MKTNYYIILLISSLFFSCKPTVKEADLQKLNGYWEIESVETTDKKVKQYNVNLTVDYFQLNKKLKGFRKKATADFSGIYKSNNRKDSIYIKKEQDLFILTTNTRVHSQTETILEITDDKLILENERGIIYHYKKHQKFDFN